jgi:hypothetical protein
MTNVIPLKADAPSAAPEPSEPERRLAERFRMNERQLRDAIRPLFLLMHEHGVSNVTIDRDGSKAVISVDGNPA